LTSKMEYTDADLVGIVFMPPKGDVVDFSKYSATQTRDDRGRWTSGAGASILANATPSQFDKLPKPAESALMARSSYVGSSAGMVMNEKLRTGKGDDHWLVEADRLQKAIDNSPALDADLKFVRHVNPDALGPLSTATTPKELLGQVLTNKGFTSMATNLDTDGKPYKHMFDKNRNVKMIIVAPKGTKGILGDPRENEFILSKKTSFMITGAKFNKTETVLEMVVVDQNG